MRRTALVAIALLALVLFLTLTPEPAGDRASLDGCLWCGDFALADAILNLLLFVPLGFLLALGRRIQPLAIWLGLTTLSIGLELTQLFLPGRFPTVSDVAMNSLGAAIGIGLAVLWRRGMPLADWSAGAATLGSGILATLLTAGATIFLQPSLPDSNWFGQWTPDLGHYEQYHGELLAAAIEGMPLPSTRLDEAPSVRSSLSEGSPIELLFVAGPQPPAPAPIFAIYDGMEREIVMFGASGADLMIRLRRRAADWRLRSPDSRYAGASPPAGDTVAARLAVRGRSTCLEIGAPECRALATPGRGWSLLLGAAPGSGLEHLLDGAWLCLAFLPLGARLTDRRRRVLAASLAGAGLLGALLLAGEMAAADWLALLLGVPLGLAAGAGLAKALAPTVRTIRPPPG